MQNKHLYTSVSSLMLLLLAGCGDTAAGAIAGRSPSAGPQPSVRRRRSPRRYSRIRGPYAEAQQRLTLSSSRRAAARADRKSVV